MGAIWRWDDVETEHFHTLTSYDHWLRALFRLYMYGIQREFCWGQVSMEHLLQGLAMVAPDQAPAGKGLIHEQGCNIS